MIRVSDNVQAVAVRTGRLHQMIGRGVSGLGLALASQASPWSSTRGTMRGAACMRRALWPRVGLIRVVADGRLHLLRISLNMRAGLDCPLRDRKGTDAASC